MKFELGRLMDDEPECMTESGKMQSESQSWFVFEPDYAQKVLTISFAYPGPLGVSEVAEWKSVWSQELKAWHCPYKVLVNFDTVTFDGHQNTLKKIERMVRFFKGFYLRKIAGFGLSYEGDFPFPLYSSRDEAQAYLGLRQRAVPSVKSQDFRKMIIIDNHFQDQIVEVTFADDTSWDSLEYVHTLKSKLTNNMVHWHSHWYLLMDISQVQFVHPELENSLKKMLTFLRGFFMQGCIGYGRREKGFPRDFPMTFVPLRHTAMVLLQQWQDRHKAQHQSDTGVDDRCLSRPSG